MCRGIDIDQNAVGGKPLGAVAGNGVTMIEMRVFRVGKRDRASVTEARGDLPVWGDFLNGR